MIYILYIQYLTFNAGPCERCQFLEEYSRNYYLLAIFLLQSAIRINIVFYHRK